MRRDEDGRLVAALRSEYADTVAATVTVDHVVVEHGTLPNDDLYLDLVPGSSNLGEVDHAALLAGQPQTVAHQPGRHLPAVPHRGRRRQPQHPRRDLRRPAAVHAI